MTTKMDENKMISGEFSNVITDVKQIVYAGRDMAYSAANKAMVLTYWNIGKRIVEDEQNGANRAKYGERLLKQLSVELTAKFGKGFSQRNLADFRKFYQVFPDEQILQTCLQNLSWSHFRVLLRVDDETAGCQGWLSRGRVPGLSRNPSPSQPRNPSP